MLIQPEFEDVCPIIYLSPKTKSMKNYKSRIKRQFEYKIKLLNKMIVDGTWSLKSLEFQAKFNNKIKQLTERLGNVNPTFFTKAFATVAVVLGTSVVSIAQSFQASAPVDSAFGLNMPTGVGYYCPRLVDIDDDGDLDLFYAAGSSFNANFYFHENLGTSCAPKFDSTYSTNPFSIDPTIVVHNSAGSMNLDFVDIDNDGDMDLFCGDYDTGNIYFFENSGTPNLAQFDSPVINPFNIPPGGSTQYLSLTFVDLDGDGDMDLTSGDYYGGFDYYENTGNIDSASFPVASYIAPFGNGSSYVNGCSDTHPAYSDIDNDGDLDLFLGHYTGAANELWFTENIGSSTAPQFTYHQTIETAPFNFQNAGIHGWQAIEFADIDGDGDEDMFIGEEGSNKGILFYELDRNGNTLPNPEVVDTVVCTGENYTFPDGTEWFSLDTDTNYTEIGVDNNGCSVNKITNITIDECNINAVEENALATINVYPNPSNKIVNIAFSDLTKMAKNIVLTNVLGEILDVEANHSTAGKYTLALPDQAGIYFVRIEFENKLEMVKVIKK